MDPKLKMKTMSLGTSGKLHTVKNLLLGFILRTLYSPRALVVIPGQRAKSTA